jgi:mannose-6-phosphate isomerase-like protein (cupin superfamily)
MAKELGEVRRVVTTVDAADKAVVLFDGVNPQKVVRPASGNVMRLVWTTDRTPAAISGPADRGAVQIGTQPPTRGSAFRIIDYPPMPPGADRLDASQRQREIGHDAPKRGLPPRHPFMHRTRSLDYVIILSGEIDMLLDDSEVHLKAGDVLIQQGTNHAWVNRGTEVCRIAFVLVDSEEP